MRLACVPALLLLAACSGEPDFDERYKQADEEIRARADAIDAQLEGKAELGGEDEQVPADE